MIDLIVPQNKNIFRFTTDIQSAVEYFCINVLNMTYEDCSFSHPVDTGNKKKYANYSVCIVKTSVHKNGYKFQIGTRIQEELS